MTQKIFEQGIYRLSLWTNNLMVKDLTSYDILLNLALFERNFSRRHLTLHILVGN